MVLQGKNAVLHGGSGDLRIPSSGGVPEEWCEDELRCTRGSSSMPKVLLGS
jgi:hypothetical protein